MTPEEQVRKAIALILQEPNIPVCDWDIGQCILANWKVNLVDQILNLKYPNGQPMIALLDESQELREILEVYNEDILAALKIDDRAFFQLPIWQREKYVQLTKEIPNQILGLIKGGWRGCL